MIWDEKTGKIVTVNQTLIDRISSELQIAPKSVRAVVELLADGATIPFIARYRKEATGCLDEVAVTKIRDRYTQLEDLEKRRQSILDSLGERSLLTDDLKARVVSAATMSELEDIYLP